MFGPRGPRQAARSGSTGDQTVAAPRWQKDHPPSEGGIVLRPEDTEEGSTEVLGDPWSPLHTRAGLLCRHRSHHRNRAEQVAERGHVRYRCHGSGLLGLRSGRYEQPTGGGGAPEVVQAHRVPRPGPLAGWAESSGVTGGTSSAAGGGARRATGPSTGNSGSNGCNDEEYDGCHASNGLAVSGVRCGPGVRQVPWTHYAHAAFRPGAATTEGATAPGVTATTITNSPTES